MAGKNKISDYVEVLAHDYPSLKQTIGGDKWHELTPWSHGIDVLKESRKFQSRKDYDTEKKMGAMSSRREKRASPPSGHHSQPRKVTLGGDIVKISPWQFPPVDNPSSPFVLPLERHTASRGLSQQSATSRQRIKTLLERKMQHPLKSTQVLFGQKMRTEMNSHPSSTLFFFKGKSPGVQHRFKNIRLLRDPSYRNELLERLSTDL